MDVRVALQTKLITALSAELQCYVVLTLDANRCTKIKTVGSMLGTITTSMHGVVVRLAEGVVAIQTLACGLAVALDACQKLIVYVSNN
jgi:hypothetical protein